jgi:hypothetical protein
VSKGGVMTSAVANSQPVKLCKDCRHCTEDQWGMKCSHPEVPLDDLATGERKYADHARRFGPCGRSGRLFESKQSHRSALELQMQQQLSQLSQAAYQNHLNALAQRGRAAIQNGQLGSLVGYGTDPVCTVGYDVSAPTDITLAVATSAPAEWAKPAEPEPHPFLAEKPVSSWKFTAPSWRHLLACLVFGGLLALGVRMLLL